MLQAGEKALVVLGASTILLQLAAAWTALSTSLKLTALKSE